MTKIIEELKKLKSNTHETHKSLFVIIRKLENIAGTDISTIDTKSTVKINAKMSFPIGDAYYEANRNVSLYFENGKIRIRNIFIKEYENKEQHEDDQWERISENLTFFEQDYNECDDNQWHRKINFINFKDLIKVLKELMELVLEIKGKHND